MAQHRLETEQDFKKALRDLIRDGDLAPELREEAERLQSQMASPGEWEQAKHEPPDFNPEP